MNYHFVFRVCENNKMIIYGGFRWYVVIKMCFYELVEVRNVFSNSYAYCDLLFSPPGPYSRYSLCLEASLISSQECNSSKKGVVSSWFLKAMVLSNAFRDRQAGGIVRASHGLYCCHYTSHWGKSANLHFPYFSLKWLSFSKPRYHL